MRRTVTWLLLLSLLGVSLGMTPLRGITQEEAMEEADNADERVYGTQRLFTQQAAAATLKARNEKVKHDERKIVDEESLGLDEKPSAVPENAEAVAMDEKQKQMAEAPEMNEELDTGGYPYAMHAKGIVGYGDGTPPPSGGVLPGMYTPGIYPSGQAVGAGEGGQMFSDPGQFGWDLHYRGFGPEPREGGRPLTKWMHREYNPGASPSSARNLWVRESGSSVEETPGMYPFVRSPQNIMMHEGPAAYYSNGGASPFYNPESPWHPNHPMNPLNPHHDARSPMSPLHPDNPMNPYAPKDPYSAYYYRNPASPYYPYHPMNMWSPGSGMGASPTAGYPSHGSYNPGLRSVLTGSPDAASLPMFGAPMAPQQQMPLHAMLPHPSQIMAWSHPMGMSGAAFYGPVPSEDGSGVPSEGYGLPGNYPFMG